MKRSRSNGRETKKRMCLVTAIAALLSLALAGDAPPNIQDMIDKFDLENTKGEDSTAKTEDVFGTATYDKSKTQFDGVTSEMQVTYLELRPEQGVEIPILSTGTYNTNTDFTVMLWFKIDTSFGTLIGGQPIMYLFSFDDGVACFFTDTLTLMCDSWDRRKLQIPANLITPGVWYHLTLSSSALNESFLLIQDSRKIVAVDNTKDFGFRQNVVYGWKACLGDCSSKYGFFGGIREVVLLEKAVSQEEASRAKNLQLTYDSSIKAYFRFYNNADKFEKDEFVDWKWLRFKNEPEERSYVGVDVIPNDVCPSLFQQISALRFTAENRLSAFSFKSQLKQQNYGYTMSITLMLNETACTANKPDDARKDCSLIELEGVFMLYLVGRNTIRFHFFASKNFYESASQMIFVPYDQWVTIQMSLDQFDGYMIVVADQNGNAFYRTRVNQNMQQQWPKNKLNLLRSFDGFVEHFYLNDKFEALSPYFATDFRNVTKHALINLRFTESDLVSEEDESQHFPNQSKAGGEFKLSGEAVFEDIFFEVPSQGGKVKGTLSDKESVFDGIACNDHHMTTHLDSEESFISFVTPPLSDWSKENTIEFWFKVRDSKLYSSDTMLFSMASTEKSNPQLYYQVYIQGGALKCAPFGTANYKDPVIALTDFSLENEDVYGWWHVSCSYSFQQKAIGTLYNTQVFQLLESTMVGLPKFYPNNSLKASFGDSTASNRRGAASVLVKEFRFWNKQQSIAALSNNRYIQIDPTKLEAEALLVYLRLATGSSLIENLASKNPHYPEHDLALRINDLSFIEDFIETERYSYDSKLDKVIASKVRTYHTVCPVHTYYMKQYCYNEPVNKAVLAIFPRWNEQAKRLDWEMTLVFSSVINREVIQFLTDIWESKDPILHNHLLADGNKLEHLVPASILRHESEYSVTATLTNEEMTFVQRAKVDWIPSKCKWLTIVSFGVSEGYTVLQVSPGTHDITFQLQLKRNSNLDCAQFDFFNAFSGLSFDFIMTDTDEYIKNIPKMDVVTYDEKTLDVYQFGDPAPESMLINVTIPMSEQEKLPVFKDIMIMMSVHWTNPTVSHTNLTQDSTTFQNLMYTLKFEPVANALFADLVASQTTVIKGETLILDASSSYISNMPIAQQRRSLGYEWICPSALEAFCAKQSGDQIAVPFSVIKERGIAFETPQLFQVNVVWAKPDGRIEKKTLDVSVMWYNLAIPQCKIEYQVDSTLITSEQNSLFYLKAINFAIDDIHSYDVEWIIEPELENPNNRAVLSGGKVMEVTKGSFSKNTKYKVTVVVTHQKLDKLRGESSVTFATLAPPVGGSVQVNPVQGYFGDKFTIVLRDWTSANLPIQYNVYSTFDSTGNRRGLLLNTNGPIPVNEEFSFIAQRATPIIVAVFDASRETLEYTLNPLITLPPEPASGPASASSTKNTNFSSAVKFSGEVSNEDPNATATPIPTPQSLLFQMQNTQNLRQRVNYMNVAIQTVQRVDVYSGVSPEDVKEMVNFRKQLIEELQKDVIEFSGRQKTDPLFMPARDFLIESFSLLSQLTAQPQYLDQDIVDKCTQVIYRLTLLNNNLYELVLEGEKKSGAGTFRASYFTTLENLNRFARLNSVEWTLQWVRHQLGATMDLMCSWGDQPETFEYKSEAQEFAFALFKFDRVTALQAKRGSLQVLDATYDYNAYTMYNWFTTSPPGELCAQVFAQQFGTVLMRGAYIGNSKARLQVALFEIGTGERHSMGRLSGQTNATFALDRTTYHSNQTVCMGYDAQGERWRSELCQSELSVKEVSMKCSCSAFQSDIIGIFTDFTRVLAEPVEFPAPTESKVLQDKKYVVVPTNPLWPEPDKTVEKRGNDVVVGTNFVWFGQTIFICVLTVAGSLVARKLDKMDDQAQAVSRTAPIPVAKQNHFINEVASELQEPYASVCYRKQAVMYYRTIFSKSAFPHLMSQLHPLISPFTSFYATQSRLMRFAMYILQLNIVSAVVFVYYSAGYRSKDLLRDSEVIDQDDIVSILVSTFMCSVVLTPWMSEPLIKSCSNQLVASNAPNSTNITQPVVLQVRRRTLCIGLMILSLVSSLALPVWAILASRSVPASNQYCMATTVIGGVFLATLVTNLIYLWINSCLARKVAYASNKKSATSSRCLVHYKALQIVRDMKAVDEVKDQFTLADVLPSSLECSERSLCSHHSNRSRDLQRLPQPNLSKHQLSAAIDKTLDDEVLVREEVMDEGEVDRRRTLEIICEESKQQMTEMNESSSRGLNSKLRNAGDDSQKHQLIASMLKDSILDFDNSRNEVVPMRTQLEEVDAYGRVHPEGVARGSSSEGSSLEPASDSFVSDRHNRSELHYGPTSRQFGQVLDGEEDDEAQRISAQHGKRIRSANTGSEIPLTIKPKIILQ